jgi:hypothetical protein
MMKIKKQKPHFFSPQLEAYILVVRGGFGCFEWDEIQFDFVLMMWGTDFEEVRARYKQYRKGTL